MYFYIHRWIYLCIHRDKHTHTQTHLVCVLCVYVSVYWSTSSVASHQLQSSQSKHHILHTVPPARVPAANVHQKHSARCVKTSHSALLRSHQATRFVSFFLLVYFSDACFALACVRGTYGDAGTVNSTWHSMVPKRVTAISIAASDGASSPSTASTHRETEIQVCVCVFTCGWKSQRQRNGARCRLWVLRLTQSDRTVPLSSLCDS